MRTERIYVWNENATQAGKVYYPDRNTEDDEDLENNDDIHLFAEGTEEEIAAEARRRLAIRYDKRAGGSGDAYAWRCCRNVLEYLGIDEDEEDDDED